MKSVLAFVGLVTAVVGTAVHYEPAALLETGTSAQFRSEDNYGNYNFGYNEDHTTGGTFRREVGDAHGNVAGSYGLRDADGRVRIVNYIANDDGFKADIKTNEPGVVPDDPADASINKAGPVVVATSAQVPVLAPAPEPVQVAVHSAPFVAVPEPEPVVVKSAYAFPAPAVAAVKSSTIAVAEPVAVHAPVPVTYSFPAPSQPVAKTHVAVAETAPITYQFPALAPVPVAKTHSVQFTEQAVVPVAKKVVAVAEPVPYVAPVAFPAEPAAYAFPAHPAVSAVKSSTAVVESAHYNFPPAPYVPAVKSSVAIAQPAPIPYAFPAHSAVPVAKSSFGYAAPPTTSVSYSTEVVNHAPAAYAIKSPAIAYSAPAPISYGHAATYAHNPSYYYGLHSPVVSYSGPVLRFNNIAYPGYPVVKK